MNAVKIEAAVSDLAVQPFDASELAYAFLAALGNKDTTLKKLRSGTSNSSDLAGGVLQSNNIHLAVCDVGQVSDTLKALRDSPATAKATRCAEYILLAREVHFPSTIADLYDPDNLRRAHEQNDEILKRIYIGRRFKSDTERLEKLFDLYVKMTAKASKAPAKRVKHT